MSWVILFFSQLHIDFGRWPSRYCASLKISSLIISAHRMDCLKAMLPALSRRIVVLFGLEQMMD